jgi:anti-sigma regulatory factor (Ser/Thr protein kinase)
MAGLAARLDLTLENLEDWQLALEELLSRQHADRNVELVFRASESELETRFGPSCGDIVSELEREHDGVTLGRVLSTLADEVKVESEGDEQWLVLRKVNDRSNGTP